MDLAGIAQVLRVSTRWTYPPEILLDVRFRLDLDREVFTEFLGPETVDFLWHDGQPRHALTELTFNPEPKWHRFTLFNRAPIVGTLDKVTVQPCAGGVATVTLEVSLPLDEQISYTIASNLNGNVFLTMESENDPIVLDATTEPQVIELPPDASMLGAEPTELHEPDDAGITTRERAIQQLAEATEVVKEQDKARTIVFDKCFNPLGSLLEELEAIRNKDDGEDDGESEDLGDAATLPDTLDPVDNNEHWSPLKLTQGADGSEYVNHIYWQQFIRALNAHDELLLFDEVDSDERVLSLADDDEFLGAMWFGDCHIAAFEVPDGGGIHDTPDTLMAVSDHIKEFVFAFLKAYPAPEGSNEVETEVPAESDEAGAGMVPAVPDEVQSRVFVDVEPLPMKLPATLSRKQAASLAGKLDERWWENAKCARMPAKVGGTQVFVVGTHGGKANGVDAVPESIVMLPVVVEKVWGDRPAFTKDQMRHLIEEGEREEDDFTGLKLRAGRSYYVAIGSLVQLEVDHDG